MAGGKMGINARYEYLRAMQAIYQRANEAEKSRLLGEMMEVTGQTRKHLIFQMHRDDLYRKPREKQRGRVYGQEVAEAIRVIAEAHDWISAPRLKVTLKQTADDLIRWNELVTSPETLAKLSSISISTLGRILSEIRPTVRLPRVQASRHAQTSAQRAVPETVIPRDMDEPGHFEVDLVHHGLPDNEGHLICTIQFIDVLTGWSERFGIMGYTFDAIWNSIQAFIRRCPIAMREFHTDNGSEFINWALITALGKELAVSQTRGRPHRSNDNRLVEQKNSSLVRAYVGYVQLHTHQQLAMLNELYSQMWLYYNLFQPVLRQTKRTAIRDENGVVRVRRRQDEGQTPFQRLCASSPPIPAKTRQRLTDLRYSINLAQLKRDIHANLAKLTATTRVA